MTDCIYSRPGDVINIRSDYEATTNDYERLRTTTKTQYNFVNPRLGPVVAVNDDIFRNSSECSGGLI